MPLVNQDINSPISILSAFDADVIKECEVYLLSNDNAHFYHHPYWLNILSEETGQPFYYLISRNAENKINGILPLLRTKGIPFGPVDVLSSKRLASLPRTPFAGPVADNDNIKALLLQSVKALSGEYSDYLIQIKSTSALSNVDPSFKCIEWRKTFVKIVPPKNEDLLFAEHTQRDITRCLKRAKEHNISFKIADSLEELKKWYLLYLERMRFHRVPARSFDFFKNCWVTLYPKGMMELTIAVLNNRGSFEVLAGNVNFLFKDYYYGGFGAGNVDKSYLQFGDFLMYNEILILREKGIKFYDIGEVPASHSSLEKYKKKWGTEQVQLYHNYYGKLSDKVKEDLDFSSDTSLSTKLWRKIPLPLTAQVGKIINNRL